MNKLWTAMILLAVIFFIFNGTVEDFSMSLMEGCEAGVTFIIGICAIMGVWSGLMNVAKESGLIDALASKCKKIMDFLFPDVSNDETIMMMLMGFAANVFGAGNSATVFSLKAMEMLEVHNERSQTASNAMCMFAAVNMSMLQLVPATVIQIRAATGSASPDDIILPSVIAGLLSTIVTVIVCKFYEKKRSRK